MSAKTAVDKIIEDLEDRSGLGNEWDAIDEDIQKEIRKEWIAIVGRETSP